MILLIIIYFFFGTNVIYCDNCNENGTYCIGGGSKFSSLQDAFNQAIIDSIPPVKFLFREGNYSFVATLDDPSGVLEAAFDNPNEIRPFENEKVTLKNYGLKMIDIYNIGWLHIHKGIGELTIEIIGDFEGNDINHKTKLNMGPLKIFSRASPPLQSYFFFEKKEIKDSEKNFYSQFYFHDIKVDICVYEKDFHFIQFLRGNNIQRPLKPSEFPPSICDPSKCRILFENNKFVYRGSKSQTAIKIFFEIIPSDNVVIRRNYFVIDDAVVTDVSNFHLMKIYGGLNNENKPPGNYIFENNIIDIQGFNFYYDSRILSIVDLSYGDEPKFQQQQLQIENQVRFKNLIIQNNLFYSDNYVNAKILDVDGYLSDQFAITYEDFIIANNLLKNDFGGYNQVIFIRPSCYNLVQK